jgi:hypothetical protein
MDLISASAGATWRRIGRQATFGIRSFRTASADAIARHPAAFRSDTSVQLPAGTLARQVPVTPAQ